MNLPLKRVKKNVKVYSCGELLSFIPFDIFVICFNSYVISVLMFFDEGTINLFNKKTKKQWKLLIVINFGQRETDNINSMNTLSKLTFPLSEDTLGKWDLLDLLKTNYNIPLITLFLGNGTY